MLGFPGMLKPIDNKAELKYFGVRLQQKISPGSAALAWEGVKWNYKAFPKVN
jgi:hypothetical protein